MPFTKISVLIPTRGRVERLRTLLRSYLETTRGAEAFSDLVFRVDDDDLETRAFLATAQTIVGPRGRGYADMPSFYNELAAASTGDVLMCGNDDMVFRTPLWAPLLLEEANRYPDGLFDIGVTTHNETHFPFSVVSRKAAEAMGFLWDPRIFWGDIFLRDVMGAFGRSVMLPEVRIDHDWAGFAPDRVYMESDKNITERDPTYWYVTHVRAVADSVTRLRSACEAAA